MNVEQSGKMLLINSASAAVFSATERYTLHCHSKVRAYYIEVPREAFAQRFSAGRVPVAFSTLFRRSFGIRPSDARK